MQDLYLHVHDLFTLLTFNDFDLVDLPVITCLWSCWPSRYFMSFTILTSLISYVLDHIDPMSLTYLTFYVFDLADPPKTLRPWLTWYFMSLIMLTHQRPSVLDLPDILCFFYYAHQPKTLCPWLIWYYMSLIMLTHLRPCVLDWPDTQCPLSCWRPSWAPRCPSCDRRLAWSSSLSSTPVLSWCWRTPPEMHQSEVWNQPSKIVLKNTIYI